MQNNTFSTLFVGQNLIRLSEVDSTNNFLKMMASNSEPLTEGTVIMADKQYAGRGQQGAHWLAEPGKNLTISIYLLPKFLPLEQQFFLNIAISNAVSGCLTEVLGEEVKTKWPNDIYHNNKKIGGILIENTISGGKLKSSVIGIGLNVNQQDYTGSLENRASSISLILQQDVNLIKLLGELCSHIESQYLLLKSGVVADLKARYLHSLYRFGYPNLYRQNGEEFSGTIIDVLDNGQLKMDRDGVVFNYNFKEIEFLNN